MNLTSDVWLQSVGQLAAEAAWVIAVVAVAQRWLTTAVGRHRAWTAAFVGLSLLMGNALVRLDARLATAVRTATAEPRWRLRDSAAPGRTDSPAKPRATEATRPVEDSHSTPAQAPGAPVRWPFWLWLGGALAALAPIAAGRVLLLGLRRRGRTELGAERRARVEQLARRLSYRRPVRLLSSSALAGPIAFGWWRPTIGLPADFWTAHTREQQDVMLAHELAHLAARDPLWLGLADLAAVLLWWHPLVWWARRQFRVASEAAADTGSLLTPDGPRVLAGCLVTLARTLERRRAGGWLGMAGPAFRTGLGRRVEHLLRIQAQSPQALKSRGPLVGTAAAAGLLAVVAIGMVLPLRASSAASLWTLGRLAVSPVLIPSAASPGPEKLNLPRAKPEPAPKTLTLAGGNPAEPQVMIETKWVEVSAEKTPGAGSDWLLLGTMSGRPESTNPGPTTLTGLVSTPHVSNVTAMPAGAVSAPATNLIREWRGDELEWTGQHATNAHNIRVNAALGAAAMGILPEPQYRSIVRALDQRSGVDVLAAPRLTTLSGRQAQIQAGDLRTILTGLDPSALWSPGSEAAPNATAFTTATIMVGPTVDVLPVVAAEGRAITLTILASVVEFSGYDELPKQAKVRVWERGKVRWVDPPVPRFRVRRMQTQATVDNGQTLLLGSLPIEGPRRGRDGQPDKSGKLVRQQALLFITPTLLDAAGRPLPGRAE